MNDRSSSFVLLVIGGLLIAGTVVAIFLPTRVESGSVKVIFENAAAPAQPAVEPLFPGQP
jgi:hypothetical protein